MRCRVTVCPTGVSYGMVTFDPDMGTFPDIDSAFAAVLETTDWEYGSLVCEYGMVGGKLGFTYAHWTNPQTGTEYLIEPT